ncbi:Nuclear pore protein [Rutstroemia sp. NJR-2017a BVV2]|nr:Nuclear pore protein [Rutstroemia sp. NJR-2017a BVV2]
MSGIKTITLDPDGDLILLVDPVQEVTDTEEKGTIEVPLPDDDAQALEILARLIHGRFSTVPSFVALPLLTQIAILVDKYQLREIVQLNATGWSFNLTLRGLSYDSWPDRLRLLCISYVLRVDLEFRSITKIICRECDKDVAKLAEESGLAYLPIPQSVFEALRQLAITKAISQLDSLILKYHHPSTNCSLQKVPTVQRGAMLVPAPGYDEITVHRNHCDAMVLGCLIRSASAQSLYPLPLPPFDSYSVSSVHQGINNLKVTTACAKLSRNPADNHGVLAGLQENMKEIWNSMNGLGLAAFQQITTLVNRLRMSLPSTTITLDPDGDLVLMLDPVEEVPKLEQESQSVTSEEQSDTPTSDIAEPIIKTVYKTCLVVSSKHMCLASPVFKAMLQGEFREGKELREMKQLDLPLPDDDTEAMKILVYIIHCKHKLVPLKVDLTLLTNIALLVDKYRLHEVLGIMVPIWKKHLEADSLKKFRSVIRWICIAWVFDLHEEFRKATQIMQEQSDLSVSNWMRKESLHLPIPDHVLAKIEESRQKAAREGIQLFHNLLEKYKGAELVCTASEIMCPYLDDLQTHRRLCDSMVLGCLMKGYLLLGIFPAEPNTKWSILKCYKMAKKLTVTTACFTQTRNLHDNHRICEDLVANMSEIHAAAKGLILEDLKRKDKE